MTGYIVINPIIAMPDKKISDLTSIAPIGSFTEFVPIEDTLSNANFKVAREQICPLIITSNSANSVATTSFMTPGSTNSLAIGDSATAGIKNSVVIGSDATGNATTSPTGGDIAIGFLAAATAENAIVIGQNSTSGTPESISIGSNLINDYQKSVWIGHNITEIGTTTSTPEQAVVVGDLAQGNSYSVAIGSNAKSNYETVAIGTLANANSGTSGGAMAVGYGAEAVNTNNIAIGKYAYSAAPTNPSIAIGADASNNANNTIVIGANVTAGNIDVNSIALGSEISNIGNNSVAVGFASKADNSSVAVGSGASSEAINTTAIGFGAATNATGAVAVGFSAQATATNAVQLGASYANNNANTLQFLDKTIATLTGGIKINNGTTAPTLSGVGFTGTPFFNGTDLQIFNGTAWQTIGGGGGGGGSDSQTLSRAPFSNTISISNGNSVNLKTIISENTFTASADYTLHTFAADNTESVIASIPAGFNGQTLYVENSHTNYTCSIRVVHEDTTVTTAADRIMLTNGAREMICKGEIVQFTYNAILNRWIATKLNGNSVAPFGYRSTAGVSIFYQPSANFTSPTGSITTGSNWYAPFYLKGPTFISDMGVNIASATSLPTLTVNIYRDQSNATDIILGEIVASSSRVGPFTPSSTQTLTSSLSGYLPAGLYWLGFAFAGTGTTFSYNINETQFKNIMPMASGAQLLTENKMFIRGGLSLAAAGTTLTTLTTTYPLCFLY